MASVPVVDPNTVGVKVTLTVQVVSLLNDDPQVLFCDQPGDTVMPVKDTAVVKSLRKVTVCTLLGVFNNWEPKVSRFADASKPLKGSVVSQAPRPCVTTRSRREDGTS